MTAFDWDPGLETGDEQIDDQHRSLFALANALDLAAEWLRVHIREEDMAFVSFARQGEQ